MLRLLLCNGSRTETPSCLYPAVFRSGHGWHERHSLRQHRRRAGLHRFILYRVLGHGTAYRQVKENIGKESTHGYFVLRVPNLGNSAEGDSYLIRFYEANMSRVYSEAAGFRSGLCSRHREHRSTRTRDLLMPIIGDFESAWEEYDHTTGPALITRASL